MRFRRYAWAVLGFNLLVVLWGAFVRATGSGAGCGAHWPLCNGEVIPRTAAAATMIEFAHRVSSGLALILVVGLYWALRGSLPRRHYARRAALASVVFVVIEALIGAGLVLLELVGENDSMIRAGYLAAHLLNTFLLLGALALTAWWAMDPVPWQRLTGPPVRGLLGVATAAVLVVGMTGAVAALGDTLFPSRSLAEGLRADVAGDAHLLVRLRVLHPVLAIFTGVYLSTMVWRVGRKRPAALDAPWGRLVSSLVLVQLSLGMANLLLLAPVPLQLLHLLVADLLWIALVLFGAGALTVRAHPVSQGEEADLEPQPGS